jgi:hypothetical protein
VATSLGAVVQEDLVSAQASGKRGHQHPTTHLVAVKAGTRKHKSALKNKALHIVSDSWLWACEERWEHCSESLFPLEINLISASNTPDRKELHQRKRHHASSSMGSAAKKRRIGEKGESAEEFSEDMSLSSEEPTETFSNTLHPLLSFSDNDLECMDKEVSDVIITNQMTIGVCNSAINLFCQIFKISMFNCSVIKISI